MGGGRTPTTSIGPCTEVIDAGGASVLPGFVDAHNHVRLGSNPTAVPVVRREVARGDPRPDRRVHCDAGARPRRGSRARDGTTPRCPAARPTAAMLEGATGGRPGVPVLLRRPHGVDEPGGDGCVSAITRRDRPAAVGPVENDAATGAPTGFVTDFAVLGISEDGPARARAGRDPRLRARHAVRAARREPRHGDRYGITTIVEPQNGLDDLDALRAGP